MTQLQELAGRLSLKTQLKHTNINTKILTRLIKDQFNPTISKMLKFILNNNYFEYADIIYQQKEGIAMGTNAAPTLANYYLDQLIDHEIINQDKTRNYYRYIDDIFFTWTGTTEELSHFAEGINNTVPNLKFTYKTSRDRIEFLDLNIITNHKTNRLEFYTFQKALNKYSYITTHSIHPESTIKRCIKGELIRYRRNSSNSFYFNHTKQLFKQRLLERGYRNNFIMPIFNSITYFSEPSTSISNDIKIPFILPFSKHSKSKEVRQNIKSLENELAIILPGSRIITAYSKRKNIGQILTRSKISKEQIQLIRQYRNEPDPIKNISTSFESKFPATVELSVSNKGIIMNLNCVSIN
jgi:hypothetical protein